MLLAKLPGGCRLLLLVLPMLCLLYLQDHAQDTRKHSQVCAAE
jgi:hypothetical protein